MKINKVLNDILITVFILLAASIICVLLDPFSDTDSHVPLIFILAELFISMLTQGYVYGIISSAVSIFLVNIVFTYPYMKVNFSMTGYPLTFFCMFGVSITVCTLSKMVREYQKEKVRANLLRAISHDIRTPLTAIIGSIEAVREDKTMDEKTKEKLLSDATSEAQWLVGVVENLLSITAIESKPEKTIHLETQPVEEVIESSISKFTHQFPSVKVEVSLPDYPLMVDIDAVLVEQVLLNILQNSAKHGQTADRVLISVTKSSKDVYFNIEDNGVGFEKKEIISSDSTKNVGIGLSVCSTIIEAHNGHMKTFNSKEGGAVVWFSIPISRSKA